MKKLFLNFILWAFLFSFIPAQEWQQSFIAGNLDINGLFMGGSEVLHLVPYKNKLFASIGYWEDENNIWYGGNDLNLGWAQIICLANEDDSWKVDFDLGLNYLRPEILKQVIFTKDYNGNTLDAPDTLLIVGAYSPNYISGIVTANIFVRNDANGLWDQVLIYEGGFPAGENYSMRDIEIYTDQVTGIENLIISVGTQGIFSGKYNPNIDGKIEMGLNPEIGPLSIRSLGIAIANNSLYFSSGNKIFKRNDGFNPSYDVVHDFLDLGSNINSAVGGIRGLSTISNPSGVNESMLLMWCPNGQSRGTIFRLDPSESQGFDRVYETKISLLVEDYLPGVTVTYLLGAYNEFYSFTDPASNEEYHIIGIESLLQGENYPTWNSFYSGAIFVLRDNSAQYELQEINGAIDFEDNPLVAVRCYVKSPFENEDALYFGGFDPNGYTSTNNAWIYKRIWNTLDIYGQESLSVTDYKVHNNYPNPFNPVTTLRYDLPEDLFVSITVYDMLGNVVSNLVNKDENSGYKSVQWNATNDKGQPVSAGVYLYTIQGGDFRQTRKMVLLK
tara:strand:- start:134 stop:1804 length:1671 start_codon:yes stop_codon:yes gene_type:complete